MRKIAFVATELDYAGLTKEAKKMDLMLLKLAQEEMPKYNLPEEEEPMINRGFFGNVKSSLFGKLTNEQLESLQRRKNKITEEYVEDLNFMAKDNYLENIKFILKEKYGRIEDSVFKDVSEKLTLLKEYIAAIYLGTKDIDFSNKRSAFIRIAQLDAITDAYISKMQKEDFSDILFEKKYEVALHKGLSGIKNELKYMANDFRKS
jgi:hypothetical protein